MEAINKLKSTDPPQFLSQNEDLSLASRKASEYLFAFLKPYSPKSPFDKLLTDGFDAEQIWQQIDIQSHPLISSLKRDIKRFEQNPLQISSLFKGNEKIGLENGNFEDDGDVSLEEDGEDFENEDEDEEGDEDDGESESDEEDEEEEEVEDDGDGVPEVEDEFLKMKDLENFLVREEKKEYEGEDNLNKKKKKNKKNKRSNDDDDEESESDDDMEDGGLNELLMYGGGNDDDEDNTKEIRYEDFYLPNKKTPKRRVKQVDKSVDSEMEDEKNFMPKRRPEQVNESDQSDESESDDGDEPQSDKNLSTHERERKKLQAKIKQMEEANLAAKDWTMQGEVTASKRPRDSALEVDLDFEHNLRPPPVITEEVTTSLEDIIKKRISEGRFDDVQRAPKLPSAAPKERKELDDNKSKKGLAEIYEEEYAQQTGLAAAPLSHNDELRKEASELFKRLCLKLDALSHFHFAPKPVMEDMTIPTNVPALAMEEIAPVAVSDAAMLAPEEVFAGKGDIKEDAELTKEDRKRKRATKKRKFKAINAAKTANRTADKTLQSNVEAGKEV
ncbi:M phase phosphoprotein 10-like isoform X1 [Silene latifolia]|uniref:M phase phosphoprotein 10-like isoform X1 n=1 Tax=Silene latifolia TaxID=37657 RepID=UPI003D7799D6